MNIHATSEFSDFGIQRTYSQSEKSDVRSLWVNRGNEYNSGDEVNEIDNVSERDEYNVNITDHNEIESLNITEVI